MKVNEYRVLAEAVERGMSYGIHRLFKYDNQPVGREDLLSRSPGLVEAVLDEITEWFDFEDTAVELRDGDDNLDDNLDDEEGA